MEEVKQRLFLTRRWEAGMLSPCWGNPVRTCGLRWGLSRSLSSTSTAQSTITGGKQRHLLSLVSILLCPPPFTQADRHND